MDKLPSRNNTNFQQSVSAAIKSIKINNDILRHHQRIVVTYILENPRSRGLIIYHEMGSGKTWVGSAIADLMYEKNYRVVFLSAKSLHSNAKKGLLEYYAGLGLSAEEAEQRIETRFSFVSTKNRATVKNTLGDITNLNDTVLIVDEAHNMFNGIISGSKSDLTLYNLIMAAKNIKLIFLTGTLMVNSPVELMPAFNMLDGNKLFGESYSEFMLAYVDTEHSTIKNKSKFQNRIFGLVSYYKPKNSGDFPEQKPIIVEKVPMSDQQYSAYRKERTIEVEMAAKSFLRKGSTNKMSRPESSASTYRIKTRQYSNIYYTDDNLSNLSVVSPKFAKILENIKKEPAHGVVYSQFVKFGVGAFAKVLELRGYKRIREVGDIIKYSKDKTYGLLTGDIDIEERDFIKKVFNSPDNTHGEIMNLLLITATAVEGTDLKAGRHLHMMEPYWNWSRLKQFFARLIRSGSHSMLPKEERNVQPYIYLSTYPVNLPKKQITMPTTELEIYNNSLKSQRIIDTFALAVKEVSIDCIGNNCRVCLPTNRRLFTNDMMQDLKRQDNCKPAIKKKITVKEIKTDLGTFYYSNGDDGIRIFEKNKQFGGIVEIFADNAYYDDLYTKIANIKLE